MGEINTKYVFMVDPNDLELSQQYYVQLESMLMMESQMRRMIEEDYGL